MSPVADIDAMKTLPATLPGSFLKHQLKVLSKYI
jgi:hypothetical protein